MKVCLWNHVEILDITFLKNDFFADCFLIQVLNNVLKHTIREPRPLNSDRAGSYGMPSRYRNYIQYCLASPDIE